MGKRTQKNSSVPFLENFPNEIIPFKINVFIGRAGVRIDLASALLKVVSRLQQRQGGKTGSVRSSRRMTDWVGVRVTGWIGIDD